MAAAGAEHRGRWSGPLSPTAQGLLIARHPDQIGNLDGVPMWARDKANRARLADELDRARAALSSAEAAYNDAVSASATPEDLQPLAASWGTALRQVEMLEAVDRELAGGPGRTLMLLDAQMPGQAAIGIGDVDNAEHVAVLVPGLNSYVTNYMGAITGNADRLQQVSTDALYATQGGGSVATVAWIGYTAPNMAEVASYGRAEDAVPGLTALLDGIEATRAVRGDSVHLTLLGHSYGSVVSGLTARSFTPTDDLILFGSPGVGADQARELALPTDHVFVGEAHWDPVADLDWFGGTDPGAESFGAVPFQTDGGAHPLGGQTVEVTGHSDYFGNDSESLWNMVSVVIDRPDAVTVGHTYGAGDRLWMR